MNICVITRPIRYWIFTKPNLQNFLHLQSCDYLSHEYSTKAYLIYTFEKKKYVRVKGYYYTLSFTSCINANFIVDGLVICWFDLVLFVLFNLPFPGFDWWKVLLYIHWQRRACHGGIYLEEDMGTIALFKID